LAAPLRLQSITLTAAEPAAAARFYRWVLQLKTAPEPPTPEVLALGWGKEDRVCVAGNEESGVEEAVQLRMSALSIAAVGEWCGTRAITPGAVAVSPVDSEPARATWPSTPVSVISDEAAMNCTQLVVRAPEGLRIDLVFPLPVETLVARGQVGPFYRRNQDWHGLEIPGLLGVTTGGPEPAALRGFLARLGVGLLESGDRAAGPLGIGDHQWIVDERGPAGIRGFAVVVSAKRVNDLKRTLDHLGTDYRQSGSRLLTVDPTGRFILVSGVHD